MPRWRDDPIGFLRRALPLGVEGTAWAEWGELWPWQVDFLEDLSGELRRKEWGHLRGGRVVSKSPVQRAVSSCTGSGKTAFVLPAAILWLLAVYPRLRGICISTTRDQLFDRLFNACVLMIDSSPRLRALFGYMRSGKIWRHTDENVNFVTFRTSGTPEALQGLHSQGGMTLVVFDESSGVPEDMWRATAGARQDPQAIVLAMGNPRLGEGWFFDRHSGRLARYWHPRFISRWDLPGWSKELNDEKIEEAGGEETWEYRVYTLGRPPLEGAGGLIPRRLVELAMERPLQDTEGRRLVSPDTPLVAGMDLARDGGNLNFCAFTAGIDGRTVPSVFVPGRDLDPEDRVAWALACANEPRPPYGVPDVVYYDASGMDGMFEHELQRYPGGDKFIPVVSKRKSLRPGTNCANLRAEMFQGFRRWMYKGGCLRSDQDMLRLLTAVNAVWDRSERRFTLTPKLDLGIRCGRTRLDEMDARILSCLEPPDTFARSPSKTYGTMPAGGSHSFGGRTGGEARSWMA